MKTHRRRAWRTSAAGAWSACSIFSASCGSSIEPGVSVELVSSSVALAADAIMLADERTEVRVGAAIWTNAEVEIVTCPSLAARIGGLILPSAWAHGMAAPTRSVVPVILSASRTEPVELGTLAPPAGEYCSVIYRLGPADADAVGLGEQPDMLGVSVRVRGTYRRDAGPWQDFELVSSAPVDIFRSDLALDLTRPGAVATVRVEHGLAEWFRGVDFDAMAASSQAEPGASQARLLGNIAASARVQLE